MLYVIAAVTQSGNPQIPLLMTIVLMGCLLFLKGMIGRLYKKVLVDVLETMVLLNLLTFATFSLYKFKADDTKQTAVAYVSTIITFLLLMGAIVYHVILVCVKKRTPVPIELATYPLVPQPADAATQEVTYSVVELSEAQNMDDDTNSDRDDVINLDDQNRHASAPCDYHETDSEDDNDTRLLLKEHLETK